MPPSDSAICSFGNVFSTRDQSMSAAQSTIAIGVRRDHDVDRRVHRRERHRRRPSRCACRRTVPSSQQRLPERIPVRRCGGSGRSSFSGFSVKLTAWQPFFATRRTSSAISCGSHSGGSASGMKRPGIARRTTRRCASRCRRAASRAASVLVGGCGEQRAARSPGTTGSTSTRARRWRSCRGCARARRSSRGAAASNEVGSMPYSSGGRPTTAFRPMFGICLPSKTQTSLPSFLRTTAARAPCTAPAGGCSNMSGGSTTWSSTLTRIRSSARMKDVLLVTALYRDRWRSPSSRRLACGGPACGLRGRRGDVVQPAPVVPQDLALRRRRQRQLRKLSTARGYFESACG